MKNQRSKIIIIFVIVFSMTLITFSNFVPSFSLPIRNVFSSFIVPVQASVNRVGLMLLNRDRDARDLDEANNIIRELKAEVASLSEANNNLQAEKYENIRLRELYSLSDQYRMYEKIACRVISKDTDEWFQVFKIDKGSKDGIKVDMNVLSDKGLLGIVTSVGYNYAIVRSIIDDESRISGMTQHSMETCMVEGDVDLYNINRIRLTNIGASSTIVDGDKIVTSNISSKFLPNILIGYATDIELNDNQLSKSGFLIPVTDFNNLSEVLVITKLKSEMMVD
ncbi:MAG: rod shape-determining protein MreC [Lachnospiraceae bacterium]|nr:rod shape-determining protein MreC [Lachnospiraceae bacterium]